MIAKINSISTIKVDLGHNCTVHKNLIRYLLTHVDDSRKMKNWLLFFKSPIEVDLASVV